MNTSSNILIINGSYRQGGTTDQVTSSMTNVLSIQGAEVESIYLRDYPINFCLNCRECMQSTGLTPGKCVHDDQMQKLVDKIEQADAYILAAPTNLGSVTSIFKRFMERLSVFAFWPWGQNAPKYRKDKASRKKAILVSSCAAPGFIGRWFYHTHSQLKLTARIIGADVVETLFTGLQSDSREGKLSEKKKISAEIAATKLI